MSFYPVPLQPFDPVVSSQTPKPPVRYFRGNFAGTGQNSYLKPPAQDQSMWQALTNVMPITQGVLNQRWGYGSFATLSGSPNRLYDFQSDSLGSRAIIAAGLGGVAAFNEGGNTYNSSLFTPAAPPGSIIRSLTSRNYQYFCDGYNALNSSTHVTGDSLKWNGATSGGVTNWGILASDLTVNTTGGGTSPTHFGPNNPGTASTTGSGASWANTAGSIGTGSGFAVTGPSYPSQVVSQYLVDTGFSFNVSGTISGIQVSCNAFESNNQIEIQVFLTKNGSTPVGSLKGLSVGGSSASYTVGSSTDTWGTGFVSTDINSNTFGVMIRVIALPQPPHYTSGGGAFHIQDVQVTVFTGGGGGSSSSSGTGVSIISAVTQGSAAMTLQLGRTYYLIGNNSSTGHFSDLCSGTASTGPVTNVNENLLLASFNDPQVDYKYLLATADGGDPSILYQVPVLAPGMVISSWTLTSNVVTFTGVYYTGGQFTNGQSVYLGGLAHGVYLSGPLTVTGSTPTTFTANFTHGNDSATEVGVAGFQFITAIPNNVPVVLDGTTDPQLVLEQPMLYTDQFGNEFGVTLNDPPPAGNLAIKHQGRLWMAGVPNATHSVFFSKGVAELTLPDGFIAGKYEESWPGSNYFDVSDGAESVSGLLTDGQTLYIGTQNHIRRLLGNSPTNFQEPSIVHPGVGLINQEVWQLVFMQGAPAGSCWMTPDFRVIQSDFNTYVDIGVPVQDILNNLQSTAQTLAHAAFVSDGEFDLYILAVPYLQSTYCDTHLVFDLKARQWFVWQPAAGSFSLLYNVTQIAIPQWLFIDGTGGFVQIYSSTFTQDGSTPIPVTATTAWLDLGEPTRRKMLNEVQVYGNLGMTMTVTGANNLQEFSSPHTVAYKRNLIRSPFGTWNLYLTGTVTRHRYYQFSYQASNGQVPLLGSYSIASTPLDDL